MKLNVKDHYLYAIDDDGNEERICEEVRVVENRVDLLDGSHKVFIELWIRGNPINFEVARSEINRKLIPKFLDKGLTMVDEDSNAEFLVEYLLEKGNSSKYTYSHKTFGYVEINGEECYLLHNPVGLSNQTLSTSVYYKGSVTEPKGTLGSWMAMVEKHVIHRGHMELALCIGFSAQIVPLLRAAGEITDLPLVSLVGKSSTGKTLALSLLVSPYGKPTLGGMIQSLNCTENAFFQSLSERNGVVAAIDEVTSRIDTWDFQRICYLLPTGKSKERCNSSGERLPSFTYETTIVMTGERSILENVPPDLHGLSARMIELHLPWSESAKHALDLEKALLKNYGTAGPAVASWILSHKQEVISSYQQIWTTMTEHLEEFIEALEEANSKSELKRWTAMRGVLDRKLKILAIFITTAAILQDALSLKLDVTTLYTTIFGELRNSIPEVSVAERGYDLVMAFVSAHNSHFIEKPKAPGKLPMFDPSSIWGIFEPDFVWISADKVENLVKQNQLGDVQSLLQEWYQSNAILKQDRRFKLKKSLGGTTVKCYGFRLDAYGSAEV